jgi:hypothetical protein
LSCGAGLNFSAMLASITTTTRWQPGRSRTSESSPHQSCLIKARRITANLPPPMPGPDTAAPAGGIFMPDDRYCTDRRGNFGSTISAMRLHPRRQGRFAVLPKINSDSSPFGIYRFGGTLDILSPGRRTVRARF